MPFIPLGGSDGTKLELSVPSKGDTNWSEEIKTACFQKIVDHDHSTGKGVRIPAGGLAADSVITVKILDDNVTGAKIAADQIDSEHYIDGSIDLAHLAADSVDGTKIVDDAIDSEHYTDVSIDTAHIGNLQITTGKLAADAVTEAQLADSAVQVEHKKTYEIASLSGSAQNVTAIATGDAMTLKYRVKRSSTYQSGTLNAFCTDASAGYVQDEFIGTDLHDPDGDKLIFTIASNYIQVEGKSADELIYSIEFKENTTA